MRNPWHLASPRASRSALSADERSTVPNEEGKTNGSISGQLIASFGAGVSADASEQIVSRLGRASRAAQ